MQLGDLIAQFDDGAVVAQALAALGDRALNARLGALAAARGLSIGELATEAVSQFAISASDMDWVTVLGQMSRAGDPGSAFLRDVFFHYE
jgi:hypothetical protein